MTWTKEQTGSSFSNSTVLNNLGDSGGQLTYKGSVVSGGSSGGINVSTSNSNSFNLFDKSQLSSPVPSPVWTPLIPVKSGYVYTWSGGNSTYNIYDSSGTNVITTSTASYCTVPSNGAYLSIHIYGGQSVTDTFMVVEGSYKYTVDQYIPYTQQTINMTNTQGLYKSKWYGKSWFVFGDSISTGSGAGWGTSNTYATNSYHYAVANQRFIKASNYAVSGYTIGNIYTNKVAPLLNAGITSPPDLITIMAGTNDHGFNTALGTINDTPASSGSFYAVYRKTVETLKFLFPNATIGLITPIQRFESGYETDTLTVTSGAMASGNVTINLNGTAYTVGVSASDSITTVCQKIASATYTGWVTNMASNTVVFTQTTAGAVSSASVFSDSGTTGVAASFAVTHAGGSAGTNGNNANAAGSTLRQYCDAVVSIGQYYGLSVLDWYNNTGFSPYIPQDVNTFFCSNIGTHPNDAGHIRMAARIGDFVERL